jgi:hypothetical protein
MLPMGNICRLEQHATKIMRAHLRARELVHEMKQRGDFDLNVSDLVETDSEESHWFSPPEKASAEVRLSELGESQPSDSLLRLREKWCDSSLGDNETDEVVTDWARIAADAWHGESWARAAAEYQFERGKQRGVRP